MLEQLDPRDAPAREAIIEELVTVARDAAGVASEGRLKGIDPLTLRVLARHSPAGEELLRLVSLPGKFSHSQFYVYRRCHLQYAFEKITPLSASFIKFGVLLPIASGRR